MKNENEGDLWTWVNGKAVPMLSAYRGVSVQYMDSANFFYLDDM